MLYATTKRAARPALRRRGASLPFKWMADSVQTRILMLCGWALASQRTKAIRLQYGYAFRNLLVLRSVRPALSTGRMAVMLLNMS
ncbi:hypothetical protein Cob_v008388 [Colletotrichum orbiculare MAFF 240422]|uniref:Uncharacterized protein n=1 Tax=Colletotrichum orbiculare (strain 104-T / ATCC 96160 / CBS 514.97 / LARS 414 / MAFF 240422) TaxID=1213857 RepID=A0A484FMX9_COLOR|nr:hypothetical protein Cob_v008388 [Colletotrichum orbiculare MAFF 240422]